MFRLADRPVLMPAKTLIGSTVGPVVDTEVTLRNGGRVYLSEQEVREAAKFFPEAVGTLARDFGWASPETVAALAAQIAELEQLLEVARSEQPQVVSLEDALKLAALIPVAA